MSLERIRPEMNSSSGFPSAGTLLSVIGAGYIVTSFIQMTALGNFEHYTYLFQQYSSGAIQTRFIISWLARIIGLACGIGLLARNEIFRKCTLALAAGTLLTAYWKHPYDGFVRHIQHLNQQNILGPDLAIALIRGSGLPDFSEADFTRLCVFLIVAVEIFNACIVLWILTRPKVKALFH